MSMGTYPGQLQIKINSGTHFFAQNLPYAYPGY